MRMKSVPYAQIWRGWYTLRRQSRLFGGCEVVSYITLSKKQKSDHHFSYKSQSKVGQRAFETSTPSSELLPKIGGTADLGWGHDSNVV